METATSSAQEMDRQEASIENTSTEISALQPGDATVTDFAPTSKPSSSSSVKARSLAAGQVNRIVDGALPEGMSVSRDARLALQKCATISVLYLACLADAERKAAGSARTTLNVQDIRAALEAAGMAHLLPLMTTAAKRSRD